MKTLRSALVYIPRLEHTIGIIATLIGSLVCMWIAKQIPNSLGLSSLTLAILLGFILGNTIYPQQSAFTPGVGYTKGQVLRLAIMLYGFKLTFTQVANIGIPAIITDILTLSCTFLLACWLGMKIFKLDRDTTILIGAGSSICGAAAVIATEPVVKSEPYKVTIAVATVVVFGTIAMLVYPALYRIGWLQPWLNPQDYGVYIGSTVHEVAQVVVAGNAISPEVADTAVISKMIRVMLLAPFLLVLSFVLSSDNSNSTSKSSFTQRLRQVQIPWFAFIFIGVVALHTWVPMSDKFVSNMIFADNLLLTMAMFALGLTTHISAIKQAGIKPLILGVILFFWLIIGGGFINVLISNILQ